MSLQCWITDEHKENKMKSKFKWLKIDWTKKYEIKYNETFDTDIRFVEADIYFLIKYKVIYIQEN